MPRHYGIPRIAGVLRTARPLWRLLRCSCDKLWLAALPILTTLNCTLWTLTQWQQIFLWSCWNAAKVVLRFKSWKHGHWIIVSGVQEGLYLLSDWREAALCSPASHDVPRLGQAISTLRLQRGGLRRPQMPAVHRKLKEKRTPVS